ncbi:hypothetical protein PPERSA_05698 [Pseudocohnilembus persalinus]|uniref:Uncharacterized protein n=1 Tax=Pseudocohnilembus persalinus TaxID=266149 RepID=A0A0V0QMI3_PSEPJ|nr:hypothetical protein PPERSA_05698 [Pseudocohnilembus persalinus]|eukprot:KRX03340.1 hypothetical protein PPERSA_05698 [Pseudocohnilembus persalinus]
MAPKVSTLEIGRKYNLDNRFDPGDLKREIRAKQDRLNEVEQNHKKAGSQLKNQYQEDLIGTLDKEKVLVNLEEEILQLQNLKQQQKIEYNKTLEQFNQQTKIELRQFENDKQKEIQELKRQIEEMTDKKNYMEKYPERKTIYEQTLNQLNGEIEQEKIDFDNDQKRQIDNFHKKTKEKDLQTKSKIEEQQFQAKQDAWAMIKNSIRRIEIIKNRHFFPQ